MHRKILILAILAVLFLVFLTATNPSQSSLAVLLIPFIFIGLFIFIIIKLVLDFLNRGKNSRKDFIFSLALSIIVVNFLILNSVRQLSIQDGIISVTITIVLAVYLSKFQLNSR